MDEYLWTTIYWTSIDWDELMMVSTSLVGGVEGLDEGARNTVISGFS